MFVDLILIFKIIYLPQLVFSFNTKNNVDFDVLNKNLFDSLRLHPKLNVKENLTEESKNFIDKYVEDFFDLTVISVEKKSEHRSKRGLDELPQTITKDEVGTYMFNGLEFLYDIPFNDSSNIEIFEIGNETFIAGLELNAEDAILNLQIFKMNGNNVTRLTRFFIETALAFSIHPLEKNVFFAVKAVEEYFSGIWEFDGKTLKHVLNLDFSHDVAVNIWFTADETMMAVSRVDENPKSNNNTRTFNNTLVYKLLGSYFDSFQVIDEVASKIVPFSCENNHFMALVLSNKKEYFEIYRYNLQDGLYELHQRIPTHDCRDVTFFKLKSYKGYDSYLAVANYLSGEHSDEIPSILYKYVDGYFLPFQILRIGNILEFLPIQTTQGGFLLIARTEFQSLETYEFDGWTFQKSPLDIKMDLSKSLITSTKKFITKESASLVVGYATDPEFLKVYGVKFMHSKQIEEFQKNMLTWCQNNLKKLQNNTREKREINSDVTQSSEPIEELRSKINTAEVMLEQLENQVEDSIQQEGEHIIRDVTAEHVIIKDATIDFLSTTDINNVTSDPFFENLIDINKDNQWPEEILLENVQIDSAINPLTINERNTDHMIYINDNLELLRLDITGAIIFEAPIIAQTLNNIPFDQEHILMKDTNQTFEILNINNLHVVHLYPGKINSRTIERLEEGEPISGGEIDKISHLKASKMVIGGFINGVDMRTLDKYSLRIFGNQNITAKYMFEELQANHVDAEVFNGKNLKDNFILTNAGQYEIKQDVQFKKELIINQFEVEGTLDLIPVVDGKLQVLRKDIEEPQHISALKIIDEVKVLSPINLRGNIQSFEIDKLNPVENVDGPLVLDGDFEITGNTTIEQELKTNDLKTLRGTHSAKKVLSSGLSLLENVIDIHLNFSQQLNVDEIFIDRVNGINPQTWVVTGTPQQQIIHGAKVFVDDVSITGNTNFFKINNIEVSELEHSVLRTHGDQEIIGKHTILNVVADRVSGVTATIGKNSWENLVTSNGEQIISGTTVINGMVKSNVSRSNTSTITGEINGLKFTELYRDTVTKTSKETITGNKFFANFTTNNLKISDFAAIDKHEIIYDYNVEWEKADVENIHFLKTCNDVEMENFGTESHEENQIETIFAPTDLNNLTVYGNVFIESGYLNDVHLADFERDSVKIDEENIFENAFFETSINSKSPVTLMGDIEKVDLENLVLTDSQELQIILGQKTFTNAVSVLGNIIIEEDVNGFDLNTLCSFAQVSEVHKKLELHGNAVFTKGPDVHKILNNTISYIQENAWFRNKPMIHEKTVNFKNITLRDNVTVKGLVDDVDLDKLSTEYFSKSKNQEIRSGMYFANHVKFLGNLVSPKLILNGAINDIKISKIPITFLLQDEDQIFEEMVYLQDVLVDDLQGKYSVNGMNLETDLMRYDRDNVIIGNIQLNNLKTEDLVLEKPTIIQDVDVLHWMRNSILKKGVFNIEKRKIFRQDAHFDTGINLQNTLNGEMFTNETILLKSIPQIITGNKTFSSTQLMQFKNVKLKGLLNSMKMSRLLNNQIDADNLVFKSPMHFHNDISTKNLNLRKPYKGVDLEKLVLDIYDLEQIDIVEKYGELLNTTNKLYRNLREHAFYLESYRELQEIEKPNYLINSCCDNPTLMYFEVTEGSYIMHYYYWDEFHKLFLKTVGVELNMGHPPLNVETFSSNRKQFVYMEYPHKESNGNLIKGQFWRIENLITMKNYGYITSTNGVHQISPFMIEHSECFLLIYHGEESPNIYCNFNTGNVILRQSLPEGKYLQSTIINIDGVPFIILVTSTENNIRKPQGSVEIWCIHNSDFGLRQVLNLSDPPPRNVAAITHKGVHYLSIVYRSFNQGLVDILRYSEGTGKFENFQKITLTNPTKSEFSILPSGELFLFLLGSPNGTLTIYKHLGISGFKKQVMTSNIPDVYGFKQFSFGKKHFVILENGYKLRILQAQFKGNLLESL